MYDRTKLLYERTPIAILLRMTNYAASERPVDESRRDRIIDAALHLIATEGVAGTSHRKVAKQAGVPLGSMTYYFTGMDELLREAFTRFAGAAAAEFDEKMRQAPSRADAFNIVLDTICGSRENDDDAVVTYELYTLAARKPQFRDLTEKWMARSRSALEHQFDPLTARLIDALIEGLSIHQVLDRDPAKTADIVEALRRITQQ